MTTPLPNLPRKHDPDEFGIEISYAAHSDAPARVFHAMSALIEAFQEIDKVLARSISGRLQPTTLLEDIEAGSLRVWLRNVLESVDDQSLQSGDWKRVIGSFLVRAKRIMIDWTEQKTTVTSVEELDDLRQRILDEATRTNVLGIPAYTPIPTTEIARSVELISDAIRPLRETDSVRYLSSEPMRELNRSFTVIPEAITDLLVKHTIPSGAEMILIVKRPDFLGDSRWEFRHGTRTIEAKILDTSWLTRFRNGDEFLQPGDALRAVVLSTVRYGYDGEVVDSKHEITEVIDVIHAIRPSQGGLFIPREDR